MSFEQQPERASDAPKELPLRAIHAEFQGGDTQINILQTLSARGFTIHSSGFAMTKDPTINRATIVIDKASDEQFKQAVAQIQKLVMVIRASEIPLEKVSQHMQVRTHKLDEQQRTVLRKHSARIDENLFIRQVPERGARLTLNTVRALIEETGAKVLSTERTLEKGTSGQRDAERTIRMRVRNVNEATHYVIEQNIAVGGLESPIKIHLRADPRLIERFRNLIQQLGIEIDEMLIGPPNVNSTKLLDKKEEE